MVVTTLHLEHETVVAAALVVVVSPFPPLVPNEVEDTRCSHVKGVLPTWVSHPVVNTLLPGYVLNGFPRKMAPDTTEPWEYPASAGEDGVDDSENVDDNDDRNHGINNTWMRMITKTKPAKTEMLIFCLAGDTMMTKEETNE